LAQGFSQADHGEGFHADGGRDFFEIVNKPKFPLFRTPMNCNRPYEGEKPPLRNTDFILTLFHA
jgi:hypothetical protein